MSYRLPKTGKELMDFHLQGKMPRRETAPVTPLLELIQNIPRSYWSLLGAVKLSPRLGMNSSAQFHSIHQLATWLGDGQHGTNHPYLSYWDRSVACVKLDCLLEHCSGSISEMQISNIKAHIPNHLK